MGSILSRRIAGVEDIDIQANSAYRYPPKSGEWPPRLQPRPRPGLLPLARTARRAGWSARAAGGGALPRQGSNPFWIVMWILYH